MPLQKRRQGKVLRAKAVTSRVGPDDRFWFPDNYEGCRHGQPVHPPAGHPCRRFLTAFLERLREGDGVDNHRFLHAAEPARKKNPHVFANVHNRELPKVVFLSDKYDK